MKYRYCVLILCLSITFGTCSEVCAQESKPKSAGEQEILSEDEHKKAIEKEMIESLRKLTEQLIEKYNELATKVSVLGREYEKLYKKISVEVGTQTIDLNRLDAKNIVSLLTTLTEKYNNLSNRVTELASKLDNLLSSEEYILRKSTPEITSKRTSKDSGMQQYVKLKIEDKERGQEMEICLDPIYVDMNLDIPRKKTESKERPEKHSPELEGTKLKSVDNVVKYVDKSLEEKSPGKEQPTISQKVLDELLKAQKLYYAKKYNAALNMVQKSLSKQETALGYALEGSIYFTLGDLNLAMESWQAALRLNPDMDEVRTVLYKYRKR